VHIFHGAYTLAHPNVLRHGREAAALLSVGTGAVLSHRAAAAVWRIAEADESLIDVTLVGRQVRPRPGITLRRVVKLHPADLRTHFNLRLTSPTRTLVDFAAQASRGELDRAFGEARANRLITDASLKAAVNRASRNHPGAAIIRRRLHGDPGSTYTRSKGERRIRQLMTAAELPQPLVNRKLNGFTADFLWPEARLILEVDGYDTHGDRLAFERDRRRDQIHTAAGYTVIRVTWRQLTEEPIAVVARIAQALALRGA
jgi:very-short-patch-repair endonuclease